MKFESLKTPETNLLISLEELAGESPEPWLKPHGILDVFDHRLSEEEVDKTALGGANPFIEHNLAHESKFVDFLKKAILLNGNEEIIIEAGFKGFSNQRILQFLERLDYKEKILFLELIRNNNYTSDYLKTTDFEAVQLFLIFGTRELTFPIFHFTKYKMSLCGNFDLSFPIFFESEKVKDQYSEIARQAGLFIR